jgi:S1-C subfamily serine protease
LEVPTIGLTLTLTLTLTGERLVIVNVGEGSAAQDAGLLRGDEVEAVNSAPIGRGGVDRARVAALLDFGGSDRVSLSIVRRRSYVLFKLVHLLKARTTAAARDDTLWGVLGIAFVQDIKGISILDVAEGSSAAELLKHGDIIVVAEGGVVREGPELVSKVLSCPFDRVSITVRRDGQLKAVDVIKMRPPQQDVDGFLKKLSIPCVGVELEISEGRSVVVGVGEDSQAASEGVRVGWSVREVNGRKLDNLKAFEIEASLARADLNVTFVSRDGIEKKLYLWRNDLSHLQLLQRASTLIQEAVRSFKERGWLSWRVGSKEEQLMTPSAAELLSDMAIDRTGFAKLVRAIDSASSFLRSKGTAHLTEIEALAGVLERQIVGCECVHLLAQFYLVLQLISLRMAPLC